MELGGTVHGKTIDLDRALGLPDGQRVRVAVAPDMAGPCARAESTEAILRAPWWPDFGVEIEEQQQQWRPPEW